ncbi:hypothetical protein ACIGXM_21160 [Kitasatospora sp. NPDC052896]|uniref:hypothetical protein n=1 Tax=Kitasatospora sp. NPDC052896 TaxID=3364061 RepID=UPI0037C79D30
MSVRVGRSPPAGRRRGDGSREERGITVTAVQHTPDGKLPSKLAAEVDAGRLAHRVADTHPVATAGRVQNAALTSVALDGPQDADVRQLSDADPETTYRDLGGEVPQLQNAVDTDVSRLTHKDQ